MWIHVKTSQDFSLFKTMDGNTVGLYPKDEVLVTDVVLEGRITTYGEKTPEWLMPFWQHRWAKLASGIVEYDPALHSGYTYSLD